MDITPVDPKTVGKAVQLLATSHRVKVVNSVTEKSLARMQAEHSKMNAVTLLFVVAVAHFIVCDNPADGDDLPACEAPAGPGLPAAVCLKDLFSVYLTCCHYAATGCPCQRTEATPYSLSGLIMGASRS